MFANAKATFNPSLLLGYPEEFQEVANYLFQAEGTISARLRGTRVTNIYSISQVLILESLLFFTHLWFALGEVGTMNLVLSGAVHCIIRLGSES